MEKEKKQESRGESHTIVTSVSLSREFRQLMEKYAISPTWAIRKGVAIELYERGVPSYNSELNEKRSKAIEGFVKQTAADDLPKVLKEFEEAARKLRLTLEALE